VIDWLRWQWDEAGIKQRLNYRENLKYAEDPLNDIKDLGIDYFWCKCEELLPSDWSMGLFAAPGEGDRLHYQARAALVSADPALESLPHVVTDWRVNPLRAIEDLYYALGRDF
jgi:hypothetical protein